MATLAAIPTPSMPPPFAFYGTKLATRLTPREIELVELVGNSYTNGEISKELKISEETCKRHLANIFDKTGFSSRTELAVWVTHSRSEVELTRLRKLADTVGVMMNFPKATIVALCQKYGPALHIPSNLDGAKLMYAIAQEESSCGANCTPRHEPAYDHGGYYAEHSAMVQKDLALYGSAAAASYGPWQVMYVNAPSFTPTQLLTDPDACAQAFVAHMNGYVLGFRKAQTIQQIAETYNSGNFSANPAVGVLRYANGVMQNYLSADLPTLG